MKHDFEITEKLPIEFKTKWVEALRSGEYDQGNGFLHKKGRFCCLGVACVIMDYTKTDLDHAHVILKGEENLRRDFRKIPKAIKGHGHGNSESVGGYNPVVEFLVHLNDNGRSFEEIADWIEKYL